METEKDKQANDEFEGALFETSLVSRGGVESCEYYHVAWERGYFKRG